MSALSTQLGILKQVKSTHYGDRLYEASRRDVVASLLFESAQIPMVEYTQIGGYNKFQNLVNNTLNDSLGWKNFGLTYDVGIIVGNQDTGEDYTKVGIEYLYGSNGLSNVTERGSYEYVTGADRTSNSTNVTLSFNTDTGIDMFGHKFKVWYDGKSDQAVQDCAYDFNGNGNTLDSGETWKEKDQFKTVYATFDKATLAQHVYATDANITSTDNANGAIGLRSAAKNAGFANTGSTRWSVMYSRIDADPVATLADSHQGDGTTGMSATDPASSEVETYYLVSNNDDKTVDVAVSVYNELARIDKKDTTANTKTLTLGNTTGVTTQLFETATPGHILERKLTPNSVKDLGTTVLATDIFGTDRELNNSTVGTWNRKHFKLEVPETEENQIVSSAYVVAGDSPMADVNDAKEINLANGTTLKRSGIMDGTTENNGPTAIDSTSIHMVSKCVIELTNQNMIFGQNLTIYKDKTGRFIGVKTGTDYSFLYGTFADYSFGDLGTGTMQYAITGVDWDGNIVKNHVLTSISTGNSHVAGELVTFRGSSLATAYTMNTGAADTPNGGSTANQYMLNITKKFLGNQTGTMGNQIKAGPYMGFAINPAGHLVNGIWAAANTYDVIYRDEIFARVAGGVNNDAKGEGNWTVTATDAKNGFADFGNLANGTAGTGKLLATEDTKFIVVSGTGTDTLAVKTYKGITEFLDGATEVVINNADPTVGTNNGWNYYRTRADRYNNMNTTDNGLIDAVIMNVKNVTRSNASNLYYANKDAKTGTMLDGEYYQYEMYTGGVKGYYFIESVDGTAIDPGTTDITLGAFHTLTQTKTVNGQPVYAATTVPNTGATQKDGLHNVNDSYCYTGNTYGGAVYTYISTSNLSSARIGDGTANVTGTNAQTYRVDNAKVVDLTDGKSTGDSGVKHNGFNSVADINAAISRGWTYDGTNNGLQVAIVNDGVNVTLIYVIGAVAPGETKTP